VFILLCLVTVAVGGDGRFIKKVGYGYGVVVTVMVWCGLWFGLG